MQEPLDNWCPEIYRGLFIGRYNDDKISVAPCCQSVHRITPVQDFEFDKDIYLNSIRQQFDNGKKPNECKRCWDAEDLSIKSRRQSAIEFYNIKTDYYNVNLECLDYSTTWACNLSCIMCGPHNSSTWATELNLSKQDLKTIGRLSTNKNTFLLSIDTSGIKKLHFNGGEPLINNDHVIFLNNVIKNNKNQLFVSYNTNGTVFPNDITIDLWKSINLVKLFFSIDGTDDAYEYIRWPGNWQHTADNILKLKTDLPGNIMFGFNVTIGCYNVLEMPSIWQWFTDNLKVNREGDESDFNWQLASNFNPLHLNKKAKLAAIDQLYKIDVFAGLAADLEQSLSAKTDHTWTGKLDEIDRRRGTDWKSSLRVGQYYQ